MEEPEAALPSTLAAGTSAVIAACVIALSLQRFDAHIDRCILEVALMLGLAVFLAEGAIRGGRLFMPSRSILAILSGFAALAAISFFLSDLDKYHVSQVSLLRLLWPVTVWLVFVSCSFPQRERNWAAWVLQAAIWIGFGCLIWKSIRIDQNVGRLVGAAAGAVLTAGLVRAGKRPAVILPAAAVLFLGTWGFSTYARLAIPEADLLRQNRHFEKSVVQAARDSLRESPVTGTGPGSIDRKYLEYRPVDATLYRLPDWLERPPQTVTVIAGEMGVPGASAFLLMLLIPLFRIARGIRPQSDIALWALYGFFLSHEALGGGWFLRVAPPFLFFALAGILLARCSVPPAPVRLPGSAFFTGLVAIGGILILQQLFFWKTHEIEKRVRDVNAYLDSGLIERAVNTANYSLQLDDHRNDMLSVMIGAMYRVGDVDRALENSLMLLARDPFYPSVKNNIAAFYLAQNKPDSALPYMRETAELHPTVENLTRLGHIQLMLGKNDEARNTFLRTLELFPREVVVFLAVYADRADSIPDGRHILESSNYAAGHLNNTIDQSKSPRTDIAALQAYMTQSQRLKEALGLGGRPPPP